MPIESESMYQPVTEVKKRPKKWLVIVTCIFFIVATILAVVLWPKQEFQQYSLSKTSLKVDQNFGYLHQSELYAFNGLAFYKTNVSQQTSPTILSSGLKLPNPENVYWANSKGALMTFKDSFLLSQVETALRAQGSQIDEATSQYTWYLDFESNTLKLVNILPVQSGMAIYSEADNGFYYVIDRYGQAQQARLHFYNVETGQDEQIIAELGVSDVSHLGFCAAAERVCFIARDLKDEINEKLFAVNNSKQKVMILDSKGRLAATNKPDYYIAIERGPEGQPVDNGDTPLDTDYTEIPAVLYDVKNNTTSKLGFNVGLSKPVVYFDDDDNFYVLNSDTNITKDDKQIASYLSGTLSDSKAASKYYPFRYSDGSEFTSNIINTASYGVSGKSLVMDVNGNQLLFGPQAATVFAPKTKEEVQKVIATCLGSRSQESQYFEETKQFRVFFNDDTGVDANINAFSKCVTQSDPTALVGYNFRFATRDSFNGRITSN